MLTLALIITYVTNCAFMFLQMVAKPSRIYSLKVTKLAVETLQQLVTATMPLLLRMNSNGVPIAQDVLTWTFPPMTGRVML